MTDETKKRKVLQNESLKTEWLGKDVVYEGERYTVLDADDDYLYLSKSALFVDFIEVKPQDAVIYDAYDPVREFCESLAEQEALEEVWRKEGRMD